MGLIEQDRLAQHVAGCKPPTTASITPIVPSASPRPSALARNNTSSVLMPLKSSLVHFLDLFHKIDVGRRGRPWQYDHV
jgi:hypothetical protein